MKPGDLVRFKETIYYDNQLITDAVAVIIAEYKRLYKEFTKDLQKIRSTI
jgi:hypothetical protein